MCTFNHLFLGIYSLNACSWLFKECYNLTSNAINDIIKVAYCSIMAKCTHTFFRGWNAWRQQEKYNFSTFFYFYNSSLSLFLCNVNFAFKFRFLRVVRFEAPTLLIKDVFGVQHWIETRICHYIQLCFSNHYRCQCM